MDESVRVSTDATNDFILAVQTATGHVEIEAKQTETPGLAVHRAIHYDHQKRVVIPLNRWTVTHIPTGLTALSNHEYLDTPLGAFEVAQALGKMDIDWSKHDPVFDAETTKTQNFISDVVKRVKKAEELGESKQPTRFVVEPKKDGKGYAVMDTESGDIVDTRLHRGLARERADELNRSW